MTCIRILTLGLAATLACQAAWAADSSLESGTMALPGATGGAAEAPVGGATETKEWRFEVLLDGKPIGEQQFVVTKRPTDVEVWTRALFQVTVLLVPLYRYEHEDREVWRDGCLARIDTRTRTNGTEREVHGALSGQALQVKSPLGTAQLPGCVKSFAYWDPRFLSERYLLNPETGEYQSAQVTRLGRQSIRIAGQATDADRYALQTGKFRIELWYSPAGQWLALESQTADGRRLRYEKE